MRKKIGYWATHEYHRRAVERDIDEFVGFDLLKDISTRMPEENIKRNQSLFATAFLTGGRIEEVLELLASNFEVSTDEVMVRDMRLLKRYEKTGSWTEYVDERPKNKLARLFEWDEDRQKWFRKRFETEILTVKRKPFRFATSEPFADILLDWLDNASGYLFPGRRGPLSYSMAYRVITAAGIYPHWLRGQRASCLISEYGWTMEQMMEWMGWEELSTARHYARFGPTKLVAGRRIQ